MRAPLFLLPLACVLVLPLGHAAAQNGPWGYDLDRGASAVLAPADAGLPETVAPLDAPD